jgi:hypothetical protein
MKMEKHKNGYYFRENGENKIKEKLSLYLEEEMMDQKVQYFKTLPSPHQSMVNVG